MNTNKKTVGLVSWLVLSLISLLLIRSCQTTAIDADDSSGTCATVPQWFAIDDLAGSWKATNFITGDTDLLVLDSNGLYRQTIRLAESNTTYESNWLPWRVEIGQNGVYYLYLQNYRVCAASSYYDCSWVDDGNTLWTDCCGNRPVTPHIGEIVLTILGPVSSRTPSGMLQDISINLFRGCENSPWKYILSNP